MSRTRNIKVRFQPIAQCVRHGGMIGTALRVSAVLFLAFLLLAGCGVKGPPIPPQMAQPATIDDLQAAPDPAGIELSWSRPTRFASGHTMHNLGAFVILRAQDNQPFEPLVELPLNDQERFSQQRDFDYLDGETKLGGKYRYEIVSRTLDGYTSTPSNEVEFTRVRPSRASSDFVLPRPKPLPTNLP